MCRRTTCSRCQKPSWSGCGAHVEQVLGDVEPEDRCGCPPARRSGPGWISRLLGS